MSVATNRIKELREARGMTLEALAEEVGLSTSYVQRLENSERNLAVKHFDAFASALGVDARDLIDPPADNDRAIIEALRQASPAKKAAVAVLLEVDLDGVPSGPPAASRGKPPAKLR